MITRNSLNDIRVQDVLSYDEIQASTDLSGKIASASSLKNLAAKTADISERVTLGYSAESNDVSFIPGNFNQGVYIIFGNYGYLPLGLLMITSSGYRIFYVYATEMTTTYGNRADTCTVHCGSWYTVLYARKIAYVN